MAKQKSDLKTAKTVTRLADRTLYAWENSEAAQALKRLQANPRIKAIVLAVAENACPACQDLSGTYPKDQVPPLPFESCSHPLGCRSFYMPFIEELYP